MHFICVLRAIVRDDVVFGYEKVLVIVCSLMLILSFVKSRTCD